MFTPKDTLAAGTTVSAAAGFEAAAPSTYRVVTDNDEVTDVIISESYYSRTADGEVPQLHSVVESTGGGAYGTCAIPPGIEVTTTLNVTGADAVAGVVGSDAI